MICYLDSSVLLRKMLNADHAYSNFTQFEKIGSSELISIECHRVLDRYRMENLLDDDQIAEAKASLKEIILGMYIIEISDSIKIRAQGSFPTILGTLDAIHISSALLWKENEHIETLTIVSHDKQMNKCAKALGFAIIES